MELKQSIPHLTLLAAFAFNRTLWNWNVEQTAWKWSFKPFNRTLWNWNMESICLRKSAKFPFNRTLWNWNNCTISSPAFGSVLLIVPYGIETRIIHFRPITYDLLIVPYGIETRQGNYYTLWTYTFNRTLWNWN